MLKHAMNVLIVQNFSIKLACFEVRVLWLSSRVGHPIAHLTVCR